MQRRCKHAFPTIETVFSALSVQSGYKEELVVFRDPSLPGYGAWEQRNCIESSLRNWQLQNNGKKKKKEFGGAKENFMCDLK
jgi:hypothetical protein